MSEAQINGYIAIFSAAAQLGGLVVGNVKKLMAIMHPEEVLTEDEINAIEQGIVADALRRRDEREAMGKPDE